MNSISYVIPHFESIEKLKKLLNSIVLLNNDEIIIVDDCSSDEIYQKVKDLEVSGKIKVLSTLVNGGAGKARNIGVSHATNEWLLFADSDDFFVEGYYNSLKTYLDSKSYDVVYFSPISMVESFNKSVRSNRHEYYEYLIDNYSEDNLFSINDLKYKMVVPWSKLIRKEYVHTNHILFDEVKVSNDVMFSAKLGYYTDKITVEKNNIYCCVETNNSMTANVSFSSIKKRQKIFITYYNFLKDKLTKEEFRHINLTGLSFLVLGVRNNYTLKELWNIYFDFKKNKITIINLSYLKNSYRRYITKKQ